MDDDVLFVLTLVAALGCGLVAGVFFAFSTFVMKALARLPAPQGIAAMQSINIVVINPWFMTAFIGTGLVCVVLAVASAIEWDEPEVFFQLAGSALYVIGTVVVTIAFNVPRNDTLAAVKPEDADSADLWRRYVVEWTAWNHVRTVAPLVAAASLTIALAASSRLVFS